MSSQRSAQIAQEERHSSALEFAQHARSLGLDNGDDSSISTKLSELTEATDAVEASFVTSQDPVVKTKDGGRLPAIPVDEAIKLNELRDRMLGKDPTARPALPVAIREAKDGTLHGTGSRPPHTSRASEKPDAPLRESVPLSKTNPLFPPIRSYGPPSTTRDVQCWIFRISSWTLSLCFLVVIILGALFTGIPAGLVDIWKRLLLRNPNPSRPFYEEERRRKRARKQAEKVWAQQISSQSEGVSQSVTSEQDDAEGEWVDVRSNGEGVDGKEEHVTNEKQDYVPTEGGPDKLLCDAGYYARRVGLDVEEFDVLTEDGFIITLWHVYDPREYKPTCPDSRQHKSADVFREHFVSHGIKNGSSACQYKDGERRYPVLLMHGLLQSAGAYCCNDDDSLAFYLCKQGYDVWLGNNRCGFKPRHNMLAYGDPRMWAWNIRQMGVLDLPALISRVLEETGFEKLGLVAHSQGTTQTFVALAKEQRPDLGDKISVFCALAPAAYAGPLIKKAYFKFMRVITPSMFRLVFGIHSFIPFMMDMHKILPSRFYGVMGYRVFSFLFDWTDLRWDAALRDRFFQFAPVYVSAESMRWWLGRECFAKQKCILSTRDEGKLEDEEDAEEEEWLERQREGGDAHEKRAVAATKLCRHSSKHLHDDRARYAWYDKRAPPMAFWIGGNDKLVDGGRLLRRFDRGREPHVNVVHKKVIHGYEHLDVIWAIDAIEKVGSEVKEVLWKTTPATARQICRTPLGCGGLEFWQHPSLTEATQVEATEKGDEEDELDKGEEDPPSP